MSIPRFKKMTNQKFTEFAFNLKREICKYYVWLSCEIFATHSNRERERRCSTMWQWRKKLSSHRNKLFIIIGRCRGERKANGQALNRRAIDFFFVFLCKREKDFCILKAVHRLYFLKVPYGDIFLLGVIKF